MAGPFSGPLTVFRPGALPPEGPAIDLFPARVGGPVLCEDREHDGDGDSGGAQ